MPQAEIAWIDWLTSFPKGRRNLDLGGAGWKRCSVRTAKKNTRKALNAWKNGEKRRKMELTE
jgi:hypothetical protein